jgi:hypothetical protein
MLDSTSLIDDAMPSLYLRQETIYRYVYLCPQSLQYRPDCYENFQLYENSKQSFDGKYTMTLFVPDVCDKDIIKGLLW